MDISEIDKQIVELQKKKEDAIKVLDIAELINQASDL